MAEKGLEFSRPRPRFKLIVQLKVNECVLASCPSLI